jgi:cytochrome P450
LTFLKQVTVDELTTDPYPVYARMRRDEPVGYLPAVNAWLVTRHADVRLVAEHPEQFAAWTALADPGR